MKSRVPVNADAGGNSGALETQSWFASLNETLVRAAFPDPLRAQNPRARNQRTLFLVGRWFPRADAYAHARRLASPDGVGLFYDLHRLLCHTGFHIRRHRHAITGMRTSGSACLELPPRADNVTLNLIVTVQFTRPRRSTVFWRAGEASETRRYATRQGNGALRAP
jgi:hypothetical protein